MECGTLLERPRKPAPEAVLLMSWAEEWAKEGKTVDWQKLLPPQGDLLVSRVGGWWNARVRLEICHNRRMSKDNARGCVQPAKRSCTLG